MEINKTFSYELENTKRFHKVLRGHAEILLKILTKNCKNSLNLYLGFQVCHIAAKLDLIIYLRASKKKKKILHLNYLNKKN